MPFLIRRLSPKIAAIQQLVGSPITAALLPTLKTDRMLSILASWPSSLLSEAVVIQTGATYGTGRHLAGHECPRRALDAAGVLDAGADDHVLLGLDGGNDVAHWARTRPLDLRVQDVAVLLGDGREIPAKTPLSEQVSKELKKRGFKFVGPTIVYAWMQAVGIVNDHAHDCFRRAELIEAAR